MVAHATNDTSAQLAVRLARRGAGKNVRPSVEPASAQLPAQLAAQVPGLLDARMAARATRKSATPARDGKESAQLLENRDREGTTPPPPRSVSARRARPQMKAVSCGRQGWKCSKRREWEELHTSLGERDGRRENAENKGDASVHGSLRDPFHMCLCVIK